MTIIYRLGSDGQDWTMICVSIKVAHLLSISTAWGVTFWFTFVGGLIALLNLPRHQFGNVESKMWPVYFRLMSFCCTISMTSFAYLYPWKSSDINEKYQLGYLFSAFAFNLANLLFLGPMTIKAMKERHIVEKKLNIGSEIGWSKNVEVAKTNQKLAIMNSKFEKIHRVAGFAYISTLLSLAMHLWYLAAKIDV